MSQLKSTLERLARMNSVNQKSTTGNVKYFKAAEGKNNILLLPTPQTGDPFLEWGGHKALLDKPFMTINCNKYNKGEECLVCEVVDDLKRQDWKGNYSLWKPLELQLRYFSPIVDLDNISEGVQWWGYGKSVLGQFQTWLANIEDGESEFYNVENPEKVIITYKKDAPATDMYKLDKKILKPFSADQVAEWTSGIKALNDIFKGDKTSEETATLIQAYMERMKEEIANIDAHTTPGDPDVKPVAAGKLGKLKS